MMGGLGASQTGRPSLRERKKTEREEQEGGSELYLIYHPIDS